VRALAYKFVQTRQAGGGPKPQSILFLKNRERPNTYRTVARFASYEEARENSRRDDTTEMAQQIAALCDDQRSATSILSTRSSRRPEVAKDRLISKQAADQQNGTQDDVGRSLAGLPTTRA